MAKNTVLLYIRMFFLLLVGFYTVRLLLQMLGVEDYGLYNVIFGLVTSFSFFSGAMQSTIQRFICYELSQGKTENVKKVFAVSLFLFLVLSIIVLIVAETAGLWFICNKLSVPVAKEQTVQIVYQLSIFMVIFKILQVPYIAAMTSYENMGTYAKISIVDASLHLASVGALKYISDDRLVYFTILYTICNLAVLVYYVTYCQKKYTVCRINFGVDKDYLKSMTTFFSWNLFGAIANISKQQGLNLLLNVFCGVILNATWGIATQVGGAIGQFSASFQQAFNPQILKSYNDPDRNAFWELLCSCSKYSFLLIWLVSLPMLLSTEFFLELWLGKNLPDYVVFFTQMTIIHVVIDAMNAPLWVSVQATGNVRKYQIEISILICFNFILSFIVLQLKAHPLSVAMINVFVNLLCFGYRLLYLHKNIGLRIGQYCRKCLIPAVIIGCGSYFSGLYIRKLFTNNICMILCSLTIITIINLVLVIFVGLSNREKKALSSYCKRKFYK